MRQMAQNEEKVTVVALSRGISLLCILASPGISVGLGCDGQGPARAELPLKQLCSQSGVTQSSFTGQEGLGVLKPQDRGV